MFYKNRNKNKFKKIALFEKALSLTTYAISKNPKLKITYDFTDLNINTKKINSLNSDLIIKQEKIAIMRGKADMLAFTYIFHNKKIHNKLIPINTVAKSIFNMAEEVRISYLATIQMKGVAKNLNAVFIDKLKKINIKKPLNINNAPIDIALILLLRNKIGGFETPIKYIKILYLWSEYFDRKINHLLKKTIDSVNDQYIFASYIDKLIQIFNTDKLLNNFKNYEYLNKDTQVNKSNDNQKIFNNDLKINNQIINNKFLKYKKNNYFSNIENKDKNTENIKNKFISNYLNNNQKKIIYNIYTTKFDEIICAEKIYKKFELINLRKYLDSQMQNLQNTASVLVNKLMRLLLTQQNKTWEFNLEEGLLDSSKLTRVIINPLFPLSFKKEKKSNFKDTIITILIDNSGSMRGKSITVAAICSDILARVLERCNIKIEILGFTTKNWKGGESRKSWMSNKKNKYPGRLNDLRHIIYKHADASYKVSKNNLGLMMDDSLLKENIDGEALLWACKRLLRRYESRRILIVISDGAPIDESTLNENHDDYLDKHLKEVIFYIENKSSIELFAIGIGHDVNNYYNNSVIINNAEELGKVIIDQLINLFTNKIKK